MRLDMSTCRKCWQSLVHHSTLLPNKKYSVSRLEPPNGIHLRSVLIKLQLALLHRQVESPGVEGQVLLLPLRVVDRDFRTLHEPQLHTMPGLVLRHVRAFFLPALRIVLLLLPKPELLLAEQLAAFICVVEAPSDQANLQQVVSQK